jgi:diguanylate cyclase (GGDEF)-like protein
MLQEEMRVAVTELDQAIYAHEQWVEEIYTVLICHVPADDRDIDGNSFHKCRFGQWYYGGGAAKLADRAGFAELEIEHKRMHQYASDLLRTVVRGAPVSLHDYERFVSALKRTQLEIRTLKHELEVSLYNIDALTGVPGRMEMLRKLREQREFVRRDVHTCVIAMLDIDFFKAVNDEHGHLAGDKVLIAIAQYVQSHLRPYDLIFRYGGEEFLICMPDTDLGAGHEISDRLRAEIAELAHKANGAEAFRVTVSIGVAALEAEIAVEEAIDRADRALLAAKAAGRNRTLAWSPAMAAEPRAVL